MKKVSFTFITSGGFALLPLFSFPQTTKVMRPNILLILADDLGCRDLGCLGSNYYETPNIDGIAHSGMVFTNGYAACQVSSPSRASILTGKFPARHGITDWIGGKSGEDWRKMNRQNKLIPADYVRNLPSVFTTLPEALKEAGYITFLAGKWHLGGKGSWPEDHGFDINIGGWDAGSPKGGYFSPYKNPNLSDGKPGEELSMRLARETVKFLKGNQTGKPFFAFLSFYAVHAPLETTREKWEKYRNKAEQMGVATSGFKMGHFLPVRQVQDHPVFAGMIESMDEAVGLVLKTLKELNLDQNTIVVFTSDNGGLSSGDSYSTSNLPYRGGKGHSFEGGIREPYFIKVPGLTMTGQKCETPVSGTDFYPTLLDLGGLKLRPGEHSDGISLVPLLKGLKVKERSLIWHYPHYGNQGGDPSSAIRKGDWKLIHYYEDGHEELYDLKNDPTESADLSGIKKDMVKNLHNELFDYLNKVHAKFPEADPQYSPEKERERLENIEKNVLPALERDRLRYLSRDFDPQNNWWESQVAD